MSFAQFAPSQLAFGIAQDIGGRPYQEDAFVAILDFNSLLPKDSRHDLNIPRSFFAVYDGHGGSGCVTYVEQNLHLRLVEALEREDTVEGALEMAFKLTEEQWLEQATRRDSLDPSGSTANCCLIVGNLVYCANAGDTRSVLFESSTAAIELSEDHKPNLVTERERIESVGGSVMAKETMKKSWFLGKAKKVSRGPKRCYPGGLAVARSFGDIRSKIEEFGGLEGVVIARPDITITEVDEEVKCILIGSDGLWDNVHRDEYGDLFDDMKQTFKKSHKKAAEEPELAENPTRLNDFCAIRMAQSAVEYAMIDQSKYAADNTTALVVLFPQGFSRSVPHNLDAAVVA